MTGGVGELVRNFLHAAVLAIACSIGFKVVLHHSDSSAISLLCFLVRLLLLQTVDVLLQRFESWEEDESTCWALRAAAALLRRLRRLLALSPERSATVERQRRALQEVRRRRQTMQHQLAREDLTRLQNKLPSAAPLSSSSALHSRRPVCFEQTARLLPSGSSSLEEDTGRSFPETTSSASREKTRVWRWAGEGSRLKRGAVAAGQKKQFLQLLAGFVYKRKNKADFALREARRRALARLASSRSSATDGGRLLLPSRLLRSAGNRVKRASPPPV